MPQITAYYNGNSATGLNAQDRPSYDKQAPSVILSSYTPRLHAAVDPVRNEGRRHPYACAEAQALSKLLDSLLFRPMRLSDITFNCPTDQSGRELWHPCGNCQSWIESTGGSGPNRTYRVKPDWDVVPVAADPVAAFTVDDFPKLGEA